MSSSLASSTHCARRLAIKAVTIRLTLSPVRSGGRWIRVRLGACLWRCELKRRPGRKNVVPSHRQILRHLRKTSLKNAEVGNIEHTIFYGKQFSTRYDALPFVTDVALLLEQLEDEVWKEFRFLEVRDCPPPLPTTLGVAVSDATLLLLGGGRLYVVTFLSDAYPDFVQAHLEIRASRANPDHAFAILIGEGWKGFTVSNFGSEPWVNLALKCLQTLHTAKPLPNLESIPVGANRSALSTKVANSKGPRTSEANSGRPATPSDPDYDLRLRLVCAGKMLCTVVRVPLVAVRPYSADFALDVPRVRVDRVVAELRRGASAQMLLYWRGTVIHRQR